MIVHKTKTAMQDRTNPLETASYIFPISNRKNKTTSTQTHHCMVFLENTKKGYLSTNVVGVVAPIISPRKGYGDFVHHTNPLKEGGLLTLSIDNSLFDLISVREPELVNLLIQLNYRESRESANSLIQLNSVDSTESVNPLIKIDYNESLELANSLISLNPVTKLELSNSLKMLQTPNMASAQVLYRRNLQKHKEKGSVRSTALWDDCTFNHEENHYSTDLDDTRNPDLAYLINQQVSQPSFIGEHILTTIGGWDLRLYGTLSPAQTLHTEIIGTQNLQVVKSYSQNNPEIIGAVGSANDISSAQPFGSMPSFCSLSRQESFTHELNFPFPATASICSSNESSKRIIFRVLPERSFFFFRFFSCITAYSFFGDFGDLTGGSGFGASCLLADLERSCSIFCLAALVIVSISFPALALMVSILVRVSIADARSSHAEPPSWRRAISPRMAVTINPALLSSGLFNVSIPSITSCGMRIEICFDLSLTVFLAMSVYPMIWCDSVYIIIKSQKTLTCDSPVFNLNHTSLLWCDSQKRNPTVREHMWGSYPQCYRS